MTVGGLFGYNQSHLIKPHPHSPDEADVLGKYLSVNDKQIIHLEVCLCLFSNGDLMFSGALCLTNCLS